MPPRNVSLAIDVSVAMVKGVPPSVVFDGRATVPLNVGLAVSALVLIAVEMLSNSVSNSAPLMILSGSPLVSVSFAAKSVVLM